MRNLTTMLFLILVIGLNSRAQDSPTDFDITQINTTDGLSQNTVRSICIDRQGFLWAGTLDGLNRYDGNGFVIYKPQLGNVNSLSDPRIRSIQEDFAGYLWIKKYDNTYSCYNPKLDVFINVEDSQGQPIDMSFTEVYFASDSTVFLYGGIAGAAKVIVSGTDKPLAIWVEQQKKYYDLVEDNGNVWLVGDDLVRIKNNGNAKHYDIPGMSVSRFMCLLSNVIFITDNSDKLFRFDTKKEVPLKSLSSSGNAKFLSCHKADTSLLMLTTRQHGVIAYDVVQKRFVSSAEINAQGIANEAEIITDNLGQIWACDHSGIIYRYSSDTRKMIPIRVITPDVAKVIDYERYAVFVDSRGYYWITTYGCGLVLYNPQNDETQSFKYNGTEKGISSDFLLSIAEDRYGNIWVGSEYAGIMKLSSKQYNISVLKPEASTTLGSSNNVRVIYEDNNGNIWLGTKNGSLYVYDITMEQLLYSRKNINPYAIVHDKKGRIWIGTKGNGVYVYDSFSMREIAHYENDENDPVSLCHNSVFYILVDSQGRVWIATFGGGLDLVEENASGKVSFHHFFNTQDNRAFIRSLLEDHSGMIWAGSYDGLIGFVPDELIVDPNDYVLYQYNINDLDGLSCEDIKCICEDSRQRLWIGTAGGGLNRIHFDGNHCKFDKFTSQQGLPSDIVTSLINTNDSTLWVGTENGLACFDINKQSFVNLLLPGSTYGNFFNENASVKRRNGHLLWGTLDGMVTFDPENVLESPKSPTPVLTELIVDEQRVGGMAKNSPLEASINYSSKIRLRYNQNTFTIVFASLNLTNPLSNKYSYMLKGFDTQWSPMSLSNSATYKRLAPGKYTFMVRNATDPETKFTSIDVVVIPPWWKSTLALIFYMIFFIVLFGVILFIINKMNLLRNSVTMEHEITDYKLRFFTNISHEFRTPLTLIQGTVDALVDDTTGWPAATKAHIDILARNTRHLSRLIDQLLEFRKIQNKVLTLNLEEVNISAYVTDIFNSFDDVAKQKRIKYTLEVPDVWKILIDRNKVEKIVYNYISNAFKFTPDGGSIAVCVVRTDSDWCHISVADTGCGIPKVKQSQIFKRFMQVNFSANGTGVGLSLVKEFVEAHHGKAFYNDNPGGGAIFSVEFPTDYSHFPDVNIITKEQSASNGELPEGIEEAENTDEPDDMQYTVLVIDDNKDILEFLTMQLSQHFVVVTAENGQQGLDVIAHQMPDLVVCDVKMPVMDGLEFTQKIRSDFRTSHIPIILLTAHPSDSIQLESSESGADAYIMKPFSLKYLLSRIYKLIEQREMLRQRFAQQHQQDEVELPDQNFMRKLDAIIEKNVSRVDFGIEDLMSELNMSRSNIYKKLRMAADCTPGEYVKLWRMNLARKLIKEGGLTVSQVALQIGMEDPFYFSKCFKRQFGCSPSKFNGNVG